MEDPELEEGSRTPAAVKALAAIAGLSGLLMTLEVLLRVALFFRGVPLPWSGSHVLFFFLPVPGFSTPAAVSWLIDLLGGGVCLYMARGLLKRKSPAWHAAMACAVLLVVCKFLSHAYRNFNLYVLKNVPAVWADAPWADQMTSLANLPEDLLPILARLFLYAGVAAYLFEKRGMFGVEIDRPRWMGSRSWEIAFVGIASGLIAVERIYSVLHAHITRSTVPGAIFLGFRLPAPFDGFFLLGSIALVAYLAYGLFKLTGKTLPLSWLCLGYLALSEIFRSVRVIPQLVATAPEPHALITWNGVAQNILLLLIAVLVYSVVGLYLFEAKEQFSREPSD